MRVPPFPPLPPGLEEAIQQKEQIDRLLGGGALARVREVTEGAQQMVKALQGAAGQVREAFEDRTRMIDAALGTARRDLLDFSRRFAETIRLIPSELLEVPKMPVLARAGQVGELLRGQELIREVLRQVPDLGRLAEQAAEYLDRLPDAVRADLEVLGNHGWYADDGMTYEDIHNYAERFRTEDAAGVHDSLCDYFEAQLDRIEGELVARFPHRAMLIQEAFGAHRDAKHGLAVTALLPQADGICKELVGVELFKKKDGRLKIAAIIEAWDEGDLGKAMLHPLLVVLPIALNTDALAGGADILNRHAVLHGLDVSYNKRVNSCRVISLLSYVLSMLQERTPAAA